MSKRLKIYALFSKRAKEQLKNDNEIQQLQRTASQSSYMNQRKKIYVNMKPYSEEDNDHHKNDDSNNNSNDHENNGHHVYNTNRIRTSKYTPLTFIPKNLFEQFRGIANLYFLFLVILQCIPLFGVVEPAVSALPLIAILVITAIKDGIEDFKRNQSDDRVNKSKTRILSHWENVNLPPEPNGLIFTFHAFLGFFYMLAGIENRYSYIYRISKLKNIPIIKAEHHDHDHHHMNKQKQEINNDNHHEENEEDEHLHRQHSRPHSIRRPSTLATQEGGQPVLIDDYPLSERYGASPSISRTSTTNSYLPQYIEPPPCLPQKKQSLKTPKKILSTVRQRSDTLKSELSNIFYPNNITSTKFTLSTSNTTTATNQQRHSKTPSFLNLNQHHLHHDKIKTCTDTSPSDPPAKNCPVAWQMIQWQDVMVGDYVLLRNDDDVPADIVILSTSENDNICCIETQNLDGETNLKVKQALSATSEIKSVHDCERAKFYIECEPPHPNLYQFNGALRWNIDNSNINMQYDADDDQDDDDENNNNNSNDNDIRYPNEVDSDNDNNDNDIIENSNKNNNNQNDDEIKKVSNPLMKTTSLVSHQKTEAITANNLLLRGSVLRNTGWVIGVAVYTGKDTKIMLNSGHTPSKRSRISKKTNPHVIINFMILACLCIITAILASVYYSGSGSYRFFDFGKEGSSGSWLGFVTFWVALILYQNIVPISLYISVEIVKTFAAYFIHADIDMYHEETDTPCLPRSWNISDDLGQIEYIFSDKTGTLTQNIMEFRKCTIGGISYGLGETEASLGAQQREKAKHQKDTTSNNNINNNDNNKNDDQDEKINKAQLEMEEKKKEMYELQSKLFKNPYLSDHPTFIDPKVFKDLRKENEHRIAMIHFFSTLALCHTAIADRSETEDNDSNTTTTNTTIEYKAQSPDEAALVATARDVGFTYLGRDSNLLSINIMGENKMFDLLNVLEFNSTRKRMSVIVRPRDGSQKIILLCKGADSVIYERLCTSFGAQEDLKQKQDRVRDLTSEHLEKFAEEGLRTLCLAYRFISKEEYDAWNDRFMAASASIYGREEKMDQVCEEIESDLLLMGGTAIEDRLQDGVPETIAQLAQSGIKLWVLTGDKTETAINIGYSCNLITPNMDLIIIKANTRDETTDQLIKANEKINQSDKKKIKADNNINEDNSTPRALVIDGTTLKYALEPNNKELLLELGTRCSSVICCRVSPKQKAQVVSLVKNGLDVLTLAIGDGANDVSMIQEANIGVGISGVEGRQAVLASDYAIAQFRYLRKLLLVHGRWSYLRTAEMIMGFFFKNIVWTFVLFWFQMFCQFTGTMIYDYALVTLYNLIFTSLPIIFLGIWDQDLDAKASLLYPELFRMGLRDDKFKTWRFWLNVLDAIFQSSVAFFFPYMLLIGGAVDPNGYDQNGLYEIGTIIASYSVIIANLFVAFCLYSYTWLQLFIIAISIASFYLFVGVYSCFVTFIFRGQARLLGTGYYWLMLILTIVACFIPRVCAKHYLHQYHPYDNDIIREKEIVLRNGRSQQQKHQQEHEQPE
ncbi:unnamed protein product [Cunninghamella blakesleeana]